MIYLHIKELKLSKDWLIKLIFLTCIMVQRPTFFRFLLKVEDKYILIIN
jgi:hypothetical protein